MTTALVMLMLAGVIVAMAWPLLRPQPCLLTESDEGPAARLAHLEERKHGIYGSIRDLGLDFRTGKLNETDYQHEVEGLKAEAVGVLAEIELLRTQRPVGSADLEARILAARGAGDASGDTSGRTFCTQCGKAAAADDRFCGACGNSLVAR